MGVGIQGRGRYLRGRYTQGGRYIQGVDRPWYWHLVVATETYTVNKQVVRILLEHCFVFTINAYEFDSDIS